MTPHLIGGFAASYVHARGAWLEAAALRGGRIESLRHPGSGPDGEALWMDIASFGDPRPDNALVITCGTHGIEGYAGSAVQTAWLAQCGAAVLPPGTAVLLIHAVNPWGFAHWQRGTENHVDLNRNFISFPALPPPNAGYSELHPHLMLSDWNETELARAFQAMDAYRLCAGEKAFSDAFNGGQYLHADGIFYGGDRPEWSNLALRRLLGRHLEGAKRCLLADLHTGIGPYGLPFLINQDAAGTPEHARARAIWGDEAFNGKGSTHTVMASYRGLMIDGFAQTLPDCEVSATAIEFGTFDRTSLQRAHLAMAWMRRCGPDGTGASSPAYGRARIEYREAFIPSDPAWRASVLREGVALCERASSGLIAGL